MALGAAVDGYAPGFPGQRLYSGRDVVRAPGKHNAEASAEIPPGTVVQHGAAVTDALQLTAVGNALAGLVAHRYDAIDQIEVGVAGYLPNAPLVVLEEAGDGVWVTVEEAVTEASPVRVRATAAGSGRGTFRTSAVAAATIRLTQARYLGRAAAGGLVLVAGNFTIGVGD